MLNKNEFRSNALWSEGLTPFSNYEFDINFEVSFSSEHIEHYDGILLNAYSEYCWAFKVDQSGKLLFSLGDGYEWRFAKNVETGFTLEVNQLYRLSFYREGDELVLKNQEGGVFTFILEKNHNLLGSRISIGTNIEITNLLSQKLQTNELSDIVRVELPLKYRILSSHIKPKEPNLSTSFRNRINLVSLVFGDLYSSYFNKYLVPSLLLDSNLKSLSDRDLKFTIYCGSDDIVKIAKSIELLEAMGCKTEVTAIPLIEGINELDATTSKLSIPPQVLVKCLADSFKKAVDEDAILVCAGPDHIFHNGLPKIIDSMERNDYFVAPHARVCSQKAPQIYDFLLESPVLANDLNNRIGVKLAIEDLAHPMVVHGINNKNDYWWMDKINDKNLALIFAKEPPPLCIHPSPDMLSVMFGNTVFGRFQSLDHDLVEYAFQKGRLKIVNDSRIFFWTEITEKTQYNPNGKKAVIDNGYYPASARALMKTPMSCHF
jgi:hypothetical protein